MGILSYIKEEIEVIKERDPAIKSSAEVLLYPSFKAILRYRIAHKLYCRKHYFLARWISQRTVRKTGIEIHPGATIGKGLFIDHGSGVVIGETTVIGDNVTLYQGVTLGGTGKECGKRHPTLEDNFRLFYDRRKFENRRRERGAQRSAAQLYSSRSAGTYCEERRPPAASKRDGSGAFAGSGVKRSLCTQK